MNKYKNKVIELFFKKEPSETTIEKFHEWLIDEQHKEEKKEALFHLWNEPNNISYNDSHKAYLSFLTKQSIQKPQPKINRLKLTPWGIAAAITLIFICSSLLYSLFLNAPISNNSYIEHYSSIGEVRYLTLPDGSKVQTNSETILIYPEDFGKKSRTLYLTGEANFKVVANAKVPFIVKSKGFSTTALGTEFNVASYPNDNIYKTTLISGSIKINQETNETFEQVLTLGEQFIHNRSTKKQKVLNVNLEDETAWQRGELIFRGVTITEIIKVLERNYNKVFHYNSKKEVEDRYNFKFRKNTSLEQVMEVIKSVANDLDYKLTNDLCYIYVK